MAAPELGLPGIATIDDVEVRFQVILKQKTPAIDERPTRRAPQQAEELRDTAAAVWVAPEAGIFPRNRGRQCGGCLFEGPCRR